MSTSFDHGYALLIGVDASSVPGWALPAVARDIDAVKRVLLDPTRCAYRASNVQTLVGAGATRAAMLEGIDTLAAQIAADSSGDATAIIYYSGHGWRSTSGGQGDYYLIPYDVQPDQPSASALRALEFAQAIANLSAERLLVVLDCCRAGGMGVKDPARVVPDGFARSAPSAASIASWVGVAAPTKGLEGLDALQRGHGRAVLNSSSAEQVSYVRKDGAMSVFTYHFIEALTGHAQPSGGDAREVLVSDIVSHVHRRVPATVRDSFDGAEQTPEVRIDGNFAVAMLLGGAGLSLGDKAPDPLVPIDLPSAAGGTVQRSAGAGAVDVVGDVHGSISSHATVVAGDHYSLQQVSGEALAIGPGASATVHRGTSTHAWDPVRSQVRALIREMEDALLQVPGERIHQARKVRTRMGQIVALLDTAPPDAERMDDACALLEHAAGKLSDIVPALARMAERMAATLPRVV